MCRLVLFACILIALATTGLMATDLEQFLLEPATYETGRQPEQVVLHDIDNDTDLDVIVANRFTDDVSVYLNTGDGSLMPEVRYDAGENAVSVAVGDLNNDSNPDLVVLNDLNAPTLSILMGFGDGTFDAASTISIETTNDANWVLIDDFDQDGNQDLAVTVVESPEGVRVCLGNGDGTFGTPMGFATGGHGRRMRSSDVNNDLYPDLVIGRSTGVSVLLNTHSGGFGSPLLIPTSGIVQDLEVADFNGDGTEDIAVVHFSESDVQILLNNGFGGFLLSQTLEVGEWSSSITSADFDNDGDLDLVTLTNINGNNGFEFSNLRNQGDGTFTSPVYFLGAFIRQSVVAGDIDLDGNVDVVATMSTADKITVVSGSGTGVFQATSVYPQYSGSSLIAADLDGGTGPDLAWVDPLLDTVGVRLNNGDGTFSEEFLLPVAGTPRGVTAADIDGFGDVDILVACTNSRDVKLLVGAGAGSFALIGEFDVGMWPVHLETADLDMDGDLDVVVANMGDNTVSVLINQGLWSFAPAVNYAVGSTPIEVHIADLDGVDGLDVLVVNESSNDVSVLTGLGDGTLNPEVRVATGLEPVSAVVTDLDFDGILDLLVVEQLSDTLSVYLGNGNAGFAPGVSYPVDAAFSVSAQDMDQDGYVDVIVSSALYSALVFRNDGFGLLEMPVNIPIGSGGWNAIGLDLNNDTLPDIVTAETGAYPHLLVGLNSGKEVKCEVDLNGDGRLNFLDISQFLSDQPDFNEDGSFNFLDISGYLKQFGQGCP